MHCPGKSLSIVFPCASIMVLPPLFEFAAHGCPSRAVVEQDQDSDSSGRQLLFHPDMCLIRGRYDTVLKYIFRMDLYETVK